MGFPGLHVGASAADTGHPAPSQPMVRDKIRWTHPLFGDVLRAPRRATTGPVKININPGPAALSLCCVDEYYGDISRLRADLANAFNAKLRWLASSGADIIQIAEATFLWSAGQDTWAAELICRAPAGVPAHVTWHMSYGAATGDPPRSMTGACLRTLVGEDWLDAVPNFTLKWPVTP